MLRTLKHLIIPGWWAHRHFDKMVLARIEAAVTLSEGSHRGELRFVLEGDLAPLAVTRGLTPRQRAMDVFSRLRVWDTAENSGVLIYVQLIDRDIEIVADRGINAVVSQMEWDGICSRMESAFRAGRFEAGALDGIAEVTALLAKHFPTHGPNPNELPDRPVVL